MAEGVTCAEVVLLTVDRVTADALIRACHRRGIVVTPADRWSTLARRAVTLVLDLDALPEGVDDEPPRAGELVSPRIVGFGAGSDRPIPVTVDKRLDLDGGLDGFCAAIVSESELAGSTPVATRKDAVASWRDDVLTQRERQICRGLSAGRSTAQLAEALDISEHTVRTHLQNIFAKLDVTSRSQVVAWLAASGSISDDQIS